MMPFYNKKIGDIFLLLRCAFIIGSRSLLILWKMRAHSIDREFVNRHAKKGASKILQTLKVNYRSYTTHPLTFEKNVPYIFMSNHQSLLDLPLIFATMPGTIRLIAKKELFDIPLFGKALAESECIPVDRFSPDNTEDLFIKAKEKLRSGLWLWIFPEGTRSKTGDLLPFKAGGMRLAREVGAQIIPVGIIGTRKVLPPGKLAVSSHQHIELRIGKPIDTAQYQKAEMQINLIHDVKNAIAQLMDQHL